jgi:N-acetylglucosaminyl-diphospho-decaprenol L-rhamnosyltransferase
MYMDHLIGISIVNYKTPHLVAECLQSLVEEHDYAGRLKVVVVDNASGDGSFEKISTFVHEHQLTAWVEVMDAGRNGGYSFGNNIAFRRLLDLGCDLIWLLNPDTRLRPGATRALVECLDSDPAIGIVGSRLEDHDGTPQVSAFNFPTPATEFINTSKIGLLGRAFPAAVIPRPISSGREMVDWVAGASMMLKAEVLRQVGMMDESYFLYYEEVDFCRAVTRAGFRIVYEPTSRVIHHVGASTGISETRKQAPRRPTYWFESRQRYFQKNFGFAATLLADFFWLIAYSSLRLRAKLQSKHLLDPPYFIRDFVRNSSFVRGRCVK